MKRLAVVFLAILLVAGCGSDSPTGPGGGGLENGSMTFNLDGSGWTATILTGGLAATTPGISGIGASNLSSTIAFAWFDEGVGTYQIGTSVGFNANWSPLESGQTWVAGTIGGSGTLNVTLRTANRVVGTFQFELVPSPGTGATGTRTIVGGSFDYTM